MRAGRSAAFQGHRGWRWAGGWNVVFEERLLNSTLVFERCFQSNAVRKLVDANYSIFAAGIRCKPVLSGCKECQKLRELLLFFGICRPGRGFSQIFEGLAAIT